MIRRVIKSPLEAVDLPLETMQTFASAENRSSEHACVLSLTVTQKFKTRSLRAINILITFKVQARSYQGVFPRVCLPTSPATVTWAAVESQNLGLTCSFSLFPASRASLVALCFYFQRRGTENSGIDGG